MNPTRSQSWTTTALAAPWPRDRLRRVSLNLTAERADIKVCGRRADGRADGRTGDGQRTLAATVADGRQILNLHRFGTFPA